VHSPKMNDERIGLLAEIGLPFVVHGRASNVTAEYSWLDVNNTRAFSRATEFLFSLNHRRISLVNGLEDMDFAYRRRAGYEAAHEAAGVATDPAIMFSGEMTEIQGYLSARQALELDTPPTAFLASSMISGIGVRRAVHERGLAVGKDISIVIFDDELSYLRNGHDVPIFTATRSSVHLAGQQSAEMLLELVKNPSGGPLKRLFEVDLVVGHSTGPAPAQS